MVDKDSDDYELMPSHELDDLRHEVSMLKKGSMTDGDKAKVLVDSMDRLSISINRLITILDDAQKDIIDEYQESKPAEKLNKLLEQNEMIAKALIAISENVNKGSSGNTSVLPPQSSYQGSGIPSMPQQNVPLNNPRSMYPPPTNQMNQNQMNQPMSFNPSMSSMDDLPPMDNIPPLDASAVPKKKFLGIM